MLFTGLVLVVKIIFETCDKVYVGSSIRNLQDYDGILLDCEQSLFSQSSPSLAGRFFSLLSSLNFLARVTIA